MSLNLNDGNKVILVLDPATSTGYCLVHIENNKADIYEYGILDVNIDSDFQGDHCIDLMEQIQELITNHSITHIAIETYFYSNKFKNGCNVNGAFRTAIHILARQNDLEYTILSITEWKKYVAGRSTPTKEQKKKWGGLAKKIYIQQALWDWWGFRFPNHLLSNKSGKPVIFRYDIVDVVGQAVYYCGIYLRIPYEEITLSVEVPENIIFKRKTKKSFEYPN